MVDSPLLTPMVYCDLSVTIVNTSCRGGMFSATVVGIALVVGQVGASDVQADVTASTSDDSKYWMLQGDDLNIFPDGIRKDDVSIGRGWYVVWPY